MMRRRDWILWWLAVVIVAIATNVLVSRAIAGGAPPMVRVFTEHPLAAHDDLTRAFITEPAIFHGEAWNQTPFEQQVKNAVDHWLHQAPGYRGACFGGWYFTPLVTQIDGLGYPIAKGDALADFRAMQFANLDFEGGPQGRITRIVNAARGAGITRIDFAYFDFENGYQAWGFPDAAKLAEIVGDPAARRRMPVDVRTLSATKTAPGFGSPDWRAWQIAFGTWCQRINVSSMRSAIASSGLAALCPDAIVNFEGTRVGAFTMYDLNGWPCVADSTIDRAHTSCPCCYLDDYSIGDAGGGRTYFKCRSPPAVSDKDPLWVGVIENLNHIRATIAQGPCTPVIETCRWSPDRAYATEVLIAHALRCGVLTFDLFNPPGCQEHGEEAAMAGILARQYRFASDVRLALPEIPLDAGSIETGGFVTTYADFMAAVRAFRQPAQE
jgi:hypothetical protein